MLVASLRDVIGRQSSEIEILQNKLKKASEEGDQVFIVNSSFDHRRYTFLSLQLVTLRQQVASLSAELKGSEDKQKELEKEQEDLLVLLDEISSKRRRDKAALREAGLAVSEDEGDDDEGAE